MIVTLSLNDPYSNNELIIWNADRKLRYEDFKSDQPDYTNVPKYAKAYINYEILFFPKELSIYELEDIQVVAVITPYTSYMESPNSELLRHEQLHFDIAEYHTRILREEIAKIKSQSQINESILTKIQNAFINANENCLKMQNSYDLETFHGIDKEKQKLWEKDIAILLDSTISLAQDIKIEDIED